MPKKKTIITDFIHDWPRMARDVLGVKLDPEQEKVLVSVQNNKMTTVRSGHARGKDFVAATASLCFLYSYCPSKVINTAPTGRQVVSIMMSEISTIWRNAKMTLGGELLSQKIKFPEDADWFLEAFKAGDKSVEAWTGIHSPHILVVFTEGSGIGDDIFNAVEGILTGAVTRFLVVGNPHRKTGAFYQSFRSPRFKKFVLNCLDAPNVVEKKIIINGQVDYEWVKDKVEIWSTPIKESEALPENHDFEFDGKWYRPNDNFLVKVMGQFPEEGSDQLIPLSWVEASMERWTFDYLDKLRELIERAEKEAEENPEKKVNLLPFPALKLGVDIAGMGRDKSVYCHRYENYVEKFDTFLNPGARETVHMENAGRIKNILKANYDSWAYCDTIGEGSGVHSRLIEQDVNSVSAKFSFAAKNSAGRPLTDLSGTREFLNMRAYCYWAIRDALDPQFGVGLMLPPNEDLKEQLTTPIYITRSDGKVQLEKKDAIIERLGCSPDEADSLAETYFPEAPKSIMRVL